MKKLNESNRFVFVPWPVSNSNNNTMKLILIRYMNYYCRVPTQIYLFQVLIENQLCLSN